MGTIASVSLPAAEEGRLAARRAAVRDRWDELERELSLFREGSDLWRLNEAAGEGDVPIGPDTRRALRDALAMAEASGGAFDPTVGPLMAIWGFRGGAPLENPPDGEALASVRMLVGWTNVVLGAGSARLAKPGMRLDLGGIAKGFAVDEAWDLLRAQGAEDFLLNLGGNIRVRGVPGPGRTGWRLGVRDPIRPDAILGTIELRDGEAVATSGDYERFVQIGGVRYGHILDARTGRPVRGVAGVTVRAPSACLADGLSTALFVLGPDAGRKLLAERHPECEALWVPSEPPHRPVATPGFGLQPLR
ncbi:MAG: FAD:protein FMN transferase [Kiritimatiellia bacterium]|jgi:thiamine biosynthesis lipoprotein